MKKYFKFLSLFLALLILCSASVLAVGAETVYEMYGYSYTILNNTSLSLYGWDDSSSDLVIPNYIMDRYFTQIGARALQNDSVITSVDFSKASKLNFIGFYAFEGCTALENDLIIPETVTTIREGAFKNCTSLPSVTINANVTEIQRESFYGCTSLKRAVLPETVTFIDVLAFGECPNLERVNIPKSVESIDDFAFKNDSNLVLEVYTDTAGHQYAVNNRIDHMVLDRQSGDVNFDGSVDILDSTEIQKFAAEKTEFTDEQFEMADINKDDFADVMDALLIQKYAIGKYDIPPIIIRY